MFNGIDIEELNGDIETLKEDPSLCQINEKLTAEWVGGFRARIYSEDKELYIGGEDDFSAMSLTQASLLACEIDVIVLYATLRGIELEKLTIEGLGEFNLSRFLNIADNPSPGFQKIKYKVKIKARNVSPEQLKDFAALCENVSPVGDSLSRAVPITLEFEVE